jgi:6-phosphogluconate dehydrogenase
MPGGNKYAYNLVRPFVHDIAARDKDGRVCEAYVGEGGSGNYVKMVHNGIEYGIMQIIGEVYDILRTCYKYDNELIAAFFEDCNASMGLDSYLLDITHKVLRKKEECSYIVDKILDVTAMNGTGTWTAQESFTTRVPAPIIAAAINARCIQKERDTRMLLSEYAMVARDAGLVDVQAIKHVLLVATYFCYLQGFEVIKAKNAERGWGIDLQQLAQIWMSGCIIRSSMLEFFHSTPEEDYLDGLFERMHMDFRTFTPVLSMALSHGVPTPAITACHQYILMMTQAQSVGNLIQSQRNYFGGHPIQRI